MRLKLSIFFFLLSLGLFAQKYPYDFDPMTPTSSSFIITQIKVGTQYIGKKITFPDAKEYFTRLGTALDGNGDGTTTTELETLLGEIVGERVDSMYLSTGKDTLFLTFANADKFFVKMPVNGVTDQANGFDVTLTAGGKIQIAPDYLEVLSATPATGDTILVYDISAGAYRKMSVASVVALATVSNGDKGDVTVSGSGDVWNIDPSTVGATEVSDNSLTLADLASATKAALRDSCRAFLAPDTSYVVFKCWFGGVLSVSDTFPLPTGGGGGGGATNLAYAVSPTGITIFSSTGTDATVPLATTSDAGALGPGDKTKLNHLAVTQAVNLDTLEAQNAAKIYDWVGSVDGTNILNGTIDSTDIGDAKVGYGDLSAWALLQIRKPAVDSLAAHRTDINNAQALSGRPDGSTHNSTYTGNILPDNQTTKQNLQTLEVTAQTAIDSLTALRTRQAAIQTLLGRPVGSVNMGIFLGSSFIDNSDLKATLQAAEYEIDGRVITINLEEDSIITASRSTGEFFRDTIRWGGVREIPLYHGNDLTFWALDTASGDAYLTGENQTFIGNTTGDLYAGATYNSLNGNTNTTASNSVTNTAGAYSTNLSNLGFFRLPVVTELPADGFMSTSDAGAKLLFSTQVGGIPYQYEMQYSGTEWRPTSGVGLPQFINDGAAIAAGIPSGEWYASAPGHEAGHTQRVPLQVP